MGYCYDNSGRLCCDVCGQSGGVRKCRCPFGYCPSTALCADCRVKHKDRTSRAAHRARGCEKSAAEYAARESRRIELIASGQPVRCSAMYSEGSQAAVAAGLAKPDMVHVLFALDARHERTIGKMMSNSTYDAIPLGVIATVADFEAHGQVTDAPASFYLP